MSNHITLALEQIKNLTGDELQQEIGKQIILVRGKVEDIVQELREIKAQKETK